MKVSGWDQEYVNNLIIKITIIFCNSNKDLLIYEEKHLLFSDFERFVEGGCKM